MKQILAILGILFIAGGSLFGLLNWFFIEFYLESVDWDETMMTVNSATWFLNILGLGIGGVLIGIAAMMRSPGKP